MIGRHTVKRLLAQRLMRSPRFWRNARARRAMAVLCYHRVRSGPDPLGLAVGHAEFEAQIATIAASPDLVAVAAPEFEAILGASRPYGNRVPVLITFDDGYRDTVTDAAPILRRHGVPAVLFVATDVLAAKPLWYDLVERVVAGSSEQDLRRIAAAAGLEQRPAPQCPDAPAWVSRLKRLDAAGFARARSAFERAGADLGWDGWYVTAADLRAWMAMGMAVGAHSCSHPRLSALAPAVASREIERSKHVLEAIAGAPVRHFAYPFGEHGDYGATHTSQLPQLGYSAAFTTVAGLNRVGDDPFTLHRKCVQAGLSSGRNAHFDPALFLADLMALGPSLRQWARPWRRAGKRAHSP